jgi:hypothetical protein
MPADHGQPAGPPPSLIAHALQLCCRSLPTVSSQLALWGSDRFRPLALGSTAVVLETTASRVVRLNFNRCPCIPARAAIPEVLSPVRVGEAGLIGWELLPCAKCSGVTMRHVHDMRVRLLCRDYEFAAARPDQLGWVNGELRILDPDCARPRNH